MFFQDYADQADLGKIGCFFAAPLASLAPSSLPHRPEHKDHLKLS